MGKLVETRTDGDFIIPALMPFIGASRTIIVDAQGRSNDAALGSLQALLICTAVMLPHQASYTLLDAAGNVMAFPMSRYLPDVRSSTGDLRRDLDEVIRDIQRIIHDYLDAATTSLEQAPPDRRINEKYHFVFAADFPNKYDRRMIEALQSISNTGSRALV